MKRLLFVFAMFGLAGIMTVFGQTGFTPLGGFSNGSSYSMESVVSGFTTASDGTVVAHGSVMASGVSDSGVECIASESLDNEWIQLYSIDGVALKTIKADGFDLESLSPGLYIVRHGNTVRKIYKAN